MIQRCSWCGTDPVYVTYHDTEWGVPEFDSRALYEKLMLDGFQAGLSWITILKKRDNFRRAFDEFDPEKIARYTQADVTRLLGDAGIVRSRAKIESTIRGAQVWCDMQEQGVDFSGFIWGFVDGTPIQNSWKRQDTVPAQTCLSLWMSKELTRMGFKFCGPVIVYAFMQACGLVNDHLTGCFRHAPVAGMDARWPG